MEFDIWNVFLLLDSATTDTIFSWQKMFSMMTKHITIIIGSYLVLYPIGEVCLVMPRSTHVHVSKVVYSQMSIRNSLDFQDVQYNGFHLHTTRNIIKNCYRFWNVMDVQLKIFWHTSQTYTPFLWFIHPKGKIIAFYMNKWHKCPRHPKVLAMR